MYRVPVFVASNNRGKIREIDAMTPFFSDLVLLAPTTYDVRIDPDETAASLRGNARIKVQAFANTLSRTHAPKEAWVAAEDSGLFVDMLDGNPGVYSARFAGDHDDAANNRRLVEELRLAGVTHSVGYYKAVVAYCPLLMPGTVLYAEGILPVMVRTKAKGRGGFGYDPHTYINDGRGYLISLAEIGTQKKNEISHRRKAWQQALEEILRLTDDVLE